MALRSPLALVLALAAPTLASCVTQAAGTPIELDDPLGLIEDSDELRLFILPPETHVCLDPATGRVAPAIPDVGVGMVEGALVDLLLTGTGAIQQEVALPPGDYVAYVRGKGTDPFSGVRNTIIAQACVAIGALASNESRGVVLRLQPVITRGDCSDTVLSPDEQCTTPGVGDCNASCQTTAYQLNTAITEGAQETPRIAGRGTQRMLLTFVSERLDVGARVLGPDGHPLTTSPTLATDVSVNDWLRREPWTFARLPGTPTSAQPAVAANGRMALATTVVPRSGEFDVRVGFFDTGFVPEGDVVALTGDTGRQDGVVGAFATDGAYLAAFVDATLGGVAVRTFASGSRTPSGAGATLIGASGTAPAVAGLATGFAVAYEASGRVMVQRVDASGAAMGSAIAASEGAGTQSQAAIAPLASGGFVVVWRDSEVDGEGTGIRGRVFDASGAGLTAFQGNSIAAGDQSAPAVAAHEDRIAVIFSSAGAVHARFFDVRGEPALNREREPSYDEFPIVDAGTDPGVAAVGSGSSALWFFTYRALTDGFGDVFGRRIPR